MPDGPATESFATELRRLYEAAGRPVLATLIHQAAAQRPPVRLNDATVSDWLSGRSVPSSEAAFRFLVSYLESRMFERGGRRRGVEWWLALRKNAWLENHARRGGRPRKGPAAGEIVEHSGRVIGDLQEIDALELEVHKAVVVDEAAGLTVLPPYLERDHDFRLRKWLSDNRQRGGIAMLVGGSSTGKTRACWEAIRAVLPDWKLWHPLTPERPEAVIEAVNNSDKLQSQTVVWLNEAQMYLQPRHMGERVATALQEVLNRRHGGPIIVLGSLWPEYFNTLVDSSSKRHEAARALLQGCDIAVPSSFEAAELAGFVDKIDADPRLRLAARQGRGRLTQYLSGVPELIRRYERADEYAKAIIRAAIDIRRLSGWVNLPYQVLLKAAPGYIDPDVWGLTEVGDGWFEAALEYLTLPCHGAPGPLSRRRSQADEQRQETLGYRLADFIEQLGRRERAQYCPPASFWEAIEETCTDQAVLEELAWEARRRGRFRYAHRLSLRAFEHGSIRAAESLTMAFEAAGNKERAEFYARYSAQHGTLLPLRLLAELRANKGDFLGGESLALEAAQHGEFSALNIVASMYEDSGESAKGRELRREAAELGDPIALRDLAIELGALGDATNAEALALKAAEIGNLDALQILSKARGAAGDSVSAERLASEAVRRGSMRAMRVLAELRESVGDVIGSRKILSEAAKNGDKNSIFLLIGYQEERGNLREAERLACKSAKVGDTSLLRMLAIRRDAAGEWRSSLRMWRKAADLGDTIAFRVLAEREEESGNFSKAERIAYEAVERGNTDALRVLVERREEVGDLKRAELLAIEAARAGDFDALNYLAFKREALGESSDGERLRLKAVEYGSTVALQMLAERREKQGDTKGAEIFARKAAEMGDAEVLEMLAVWRFENGNLIEAEMIAREAADRGNTYGIRKLAERLEDDGNVVAAERLWLTAANYGYDQAVWNLRDLLRKVGDTVKADLLSRFGLNDDGTISSPWSL